MSISIELFFQKLREYAPFSNDCLNPPASAELISKVESGIGHSLPAQLRNFYGFANGETDAADNLGLFMGLKALSLEDMLGQYQEMLSVTDMEMDGIISAKPGEVKETYFHPGWLPIAADYGGNFLAVDFSPGENGRLGQIINCGRDEETLYAVADSFDDFLKLILKQLENGNLQYFEGDGDVFYLKWRSGHFFNDLDSLTVCDAAVEVAKDIWSTLTPDWQAALQGVLGNKPPTKANLAGISKIMMLGKENLDLVPLKYLSDLRIFIGSASTYHDFTPLSQLTKLKELWIAKTNVEELGFLTPMKSLELLSIGNTRIRDVTPIGELTQLKKLSLENLAVTDYTPLLKLKKLTCLDVSGCERLDYEIIKELKKLKELNISDMSCSNLDFLADFNQLNSLTLSECSQVKPGFFEHLKGASQNPYKVLGQLPKLKYLICPYAVFEQTKDIFSRQMSYTISGGMREEQKKCYHDYVMESR